jgi:hypothetical protein
LKEGKEEMKDNRGLRNKMEETNKTDNSEEFKIVIDKVCPACAVTCPYINLDYESIYYKDEVVRHHYCGNREICSWLWKKFKETEIG